MTPEHYAYLLAGCWCIVAALLILAMGEDRRRDRDTRPDVGLSILDRGGQDDATEEEILAGMEALRATPVALDLANPPGVYIAPSPLLRLNRETWQARVRALTEDTAEFVEYDPGLYGERVGVPLLPARSYEAPTRDFPASWVQEVLGFRGAGPVVEDVRAVPR